MSDLLVQLGSGATVRGNIVHDGTSDGLQVFSAYDYIHVVCKKRGHYAINLWNLHLRKSFEANRLVWYVPLRINSVKTRKGPALTLAGLQMLLLMLGKRVKLVNSVLTRFMDGENTMITKFDLDPA
jgi:hypothetical protein